MTTALSPATGSVDAHPGVRVEAKPRFSVVIPLYNKVRHVERTLRSALAQSLPAHEIIVVDDGSTDGSAELVQQGGGARVRLIRQANGGGSKARNAGIDAATAEWVAFLDADDLWHPKYLEALGCLIEACPDATMVGTRYRDPLPGSLSASETAWSLGATGATAEWIDDLPSRWLLGACFFTSSLSVRRDVLLLCQPAFRPGESHGEDLDLWFRLAESHRVALVDSPLVIKNRVPGSLRTAQPIFEELPYLLRMEQRVRGGVIPARLRTSTQRYVDETRVSMTRDLFESGYRMRALPLLARSWRRMARRRWWLSVLMLVLPGNLTEHWQATRKKPTTLR